jgi:hypothetical protein
MPKPKGKVGCVVARLCLQMSWVEKAVPLLARKELARRESTWVERVLGRGASLSTAASLAWAESGEHNI